MAVVDGEPIGERNAPMDPRRTAVVLRCVATIAAFALITACGAPPPTAVPAPFGRVLGLEAEAGLWVEQTLESLTLEELVGQLVIEWIPGGYVSPSSPDFEPLERWVVEDKIGGVSPSIGTPHAYVAKLNALQARAEIPLLVTADFENGGPGMRINGSRRAVAPLSHLRWRSVRSVMSASRTNTGVSQRSRRERAACTCSSRPCST